MIPVVEDILDFHGPGTPVGDLITADTGTTDESSSEETEGSPIRTEATPLVKTRPPVSETERLLASITLATLQDVLYATPAAPSPIKKPLQRKIPNTIPRNKPNSGLKSSQTLPTSSKSTTNQDTRKFSNNSKASLSRVSMKFRHAETIKLPKPDYARARRLLAPEDRPLVWVSMPGDVQFIRNDERTRIQEWSLPAPARSRQERSYVVTDACLLGDSGVVMAHETGPHPVSLICMPSRDNEIPQRHDLAHRLFPASSNQRRQILSSVCSLDNRRFFTGCVDKRVLLWTVDTPPVPDSGRGSVKTSVQKLDISHAASVRALAYSSSQEWLVSAAGAKLAITDIATGKPVLQPGKQKWASNDVFNVQFHASDRNMLLVETGDLDKQARIYDLRKIRQVDLTPERLIGSTEAGAISQYVRGDWGKSLVVRPSSQNMVKVWDIRQPDKVLSEHTLSHTVTHCIFMDDCRTIAATGEHFVTFLDARV
ncbi:hypothetical protein M408DRAFT_326131 [Serendipita vermifera MAFF 305830]|uniref:Uncharacterized protein n=1 Tax=Serendipita vermifera MAFF 305830 TaxID=933852 RepID=A0A0C3B9B2_SERVB|nr:hypothetical protein M408DRAFT_326131 [Serendipita vermifera MAFF 305830]